MTSTSRKPSIFDTLQLLLRSLNAGIIIASVFYSLILAFFFMLMQYQQNSGRLSSWIAANRYPISEAAFINHTEGLEFRLSTVGTTSNFLFENSVCLQDIGGKDVQTSAETSPADKFTCATAASHASVFTGRESMDYAGNQVATLITRSSFKWKGLGLILLTLILFNGLLYWLYNYQIKKFIASISTSITLPLRALVQSLELNGADNQLHALSNLKQSAQAEELNSLLDATITHIKDVEAAKFKVSLSARGVAKYEVARKVAHDIRSPLTALTVLEKTLSFEQDSQRALFKQSISRIRDIANELLAKRDEEQQVLAELQASHGALTAPATASAAVSSNGKDTEKPETECAAVPLDRLLEHVVFEKRLEFDTNPEVAISLQIDEPSRHARVSASSSDLMRVLSNVINNAIEAYPQDSSTKPVRCTAECDGRSVTIRIADTGKGIPSDVLKEIGKRKLSFNKEQGNGLGLFHTFETIRNCGGSVHIQSAVGLGSEVQITLPVA
jgi:signal transduction histidine kinase